jgi:hypothetical protein
MSTSPILYRPFPISEVLLRHSRHQLAHEIWKHLQRRPTSAVHDRFKTSSVGWPMTYVSYGRSLCGYGRSKGGLPQVVRLLLEHGANPNTRDNKCRTPLHHASSSSGELSRPLRLEIARILLAHGADVDAKDDEGRTPFQVASTEEEGEMALFLSEYCSK